MGIDHDRARRVDAALDALKISRGELAELIGIKPPNLTRAIQGERPARAAWKAMARVLGVDLLWLTTGTGRPPAWWPEQPPNDQANEVALLQAELREALGQIASLKIEAASLRSQLEAARRARGSHAAN